MNFSLEQRMGRINRNAFVSFVVFRESWNCYAHRAAVKRGLAFSLSLSQAAPVHDEVMPEAAVGQPKSVSSDRHAGLSTQVESATAGLDVAMKSKLKATLNLLIELGPRVPSSTLKDDTMPSGLTHCSASAGVRLVGRIVESI